MKSFEIKLGFDHPDTLRSMANLASTYGQQGKFSEAELPEEQVVELFKIKLGLEHPKTLPSMNALAHTWMEQVRHNDAMILIETCIHAP
jgi:hypothetical protein